jgi:hypothetical protein
MTVNHPIIKYRLTREGRVPEYLCTYEGAFGGMYGVNTNKPGYLPKWPSPQETLYLGMGCGPIDPDGAPEGVEVIETKEELDAYITSISTEWTVEERTLVREWTETREGTEQQFNPSPEDMMNGTYTPIIAVQSPITEYDLPEGEILRRETESSVSITKTDVDGVVTIKEVKTIKEYAVTVVPFDPIAASDELWTKYELINSEEQVEEIETPDETVLEP